MVSNINLLESRRRILLNTPHIETVSDTVASFKTDIATKIKGCKIHFTPTQEGEGDPSPDNVRPIHGWDGVSVYKNLSEDFYTYNVNGTHSSVTVTKINENSFRLYAKNKEYPASKQMTSTLKLTLGNQYMISFDITVDTLVDGHMCSFGFRNTSNTFQVDARAICSNSGHYNFVFTFDNLTRLNYLSLCETSGNVVNFDATISNLEIYEVEEIAIPFPQTIYGGYVDLVNGEIVEEQLAVTLDGDNVKCNYGSYKLGNFYGAGWVYAKPAGLSVDDSPGAHLYLCDKLPRANFTTSHYVASNRGGLYYIIRVLAKEDYPDGLTNTEVKDLSNEWLKSNPLTVVYPLATPNTYPIDPQTLKALRGMNNIWSDANSNVEVSFYTH